MASKITGAVVDDGTQDPAIDVDTAIVDLLEDLQRAGRRRQFLALQHLCQVARHITWNEETGDEGDE